MAFLKREPRKPLLSHAYVEKDSGPAMMTVSSWAVFYLLQTVRAYAMLCVWTDSTI